MDFCPNKELANFADDPVSFAMGMSRIRQFF